MCKGGCGNIPQFECDCNNSVEYNYISGTEAIPFMEPLDKFTFDTLLVNSSGLYEVNFSVRTDSVVKPDIELGLPEFTLEQNGLDLKDINNVVSTNRPLNLSDEVINPYSSYTMLFQLSKGDLNIVCKPSQLNDVGDTFTYACLIKKID